MMESTVARLRAALGDCKRDDFSEPKLEKHNNGCLPSGVRDRILTAARDLVRTALRPELEIIAAECIGSKGSKADIQAKLKVYARIVFLRLPPDLQDLVTPLAEVCRTCTITAAAAESFNLPSTAILKRKFEADHPAERKASGSSNPQPASLQLFVNVNLESPDVARVMSYDTCRQIICRHCCWATKPRRATDYCSHCWFMNATVEPSIVKLTTQATKDLQAILPAYFADVAFDESASCLLRARAFCASLHNHCARYVQARSSLRPLVRQADLHILQAQISHKMRWELKVLESYAYHRDTASRQTESARKQIESLHAAEILLWFDFKQNVTMPLAQTETGDMWHGADRMEITVLGCCVSASSRRGQADSYSDSVQNQRTHQLGCLHDAGKSETR